MHLTNQPSQPIQPIRPIQPIQPGCQSRTGCVDVVDTVARAVAKGSRCLLLHALAGVLLPESVLDAVKSYYILLSNFGALILISDLKL